MFPPAGGAVSWSSQFGNGTHGGRAWQTHTPLLPVWLPQNRHAT